MGMPGAASSNMRQRSPEYHRNNNQSSLAHYHKNKHNEDFKAKRRESQMRCEAKRKGKRRIYNLKHRYNLTEEQYNQLLVSQNNTCGICKNVFTDTPRVDHDHSCCPGIYSCGKCIRGLLCDNCNKAISLLNDNPDYLISGAQYLRGPLTQLQPEPKGPSVGQQC